MTHLQTTELPTVQIATRQGIYTIHALWVGQNLAVHYRPTVIDGVYVASDDPGEYHITHKPTSRLMAKLRWKLPKVLDFAAAWDQAAGEISEDAQRWRYAKTFVLQRDGIDKPLGPVLPDQPTPADVAAAITGQPVSSGENDDEPYPVDEIHGYRTRLRDDWPQLQWRGAWYNLPTMGDVERWVYDSVCESPDGDTVEPDAPESWLAILGLM